jgi:hypothetical protein
MKALRIVILFIVVLSGCSHKYVDVEGKSLEEKIVDTWEELDCKIVEQDEQGFALGFEFKDVIVVGDSVRSGELYKHKFIDGGSDWLLWGSIIGLSGLGGFYYLLSQDLTDPSNFEQQEKTCFISCTSCIAGLGVILAGGTNRREVIKGIPDLVRGDTVCVGSEPLSMQYVNISIKESDFKKEYYTDRNGNVELKIKEIIPDPTEADSVLNLIIQYEEMVDTVNVKIE